MHDITEYGTKAIFRHFRKRESTYCKEVTAVTLSLALWFLLLRFVLVKSNMTHMKNKATERQLVWWWKRSHFANFNRLIFFKKNLIHELIFGLKFRSFDRKNMIRLFLAKCRLTMNSSQRHEHTVDTWVEFLFCTCDKSIQDEAWRDERRHKETPYTWRCGSASEMFVCASNRSDRLSRFGSVPENFNIRFLRESVRECVCVCVSVFQCFCVCGVWNLNFHSWCGVRQSLWEQNLGPHNFNIKF